MDVDRTDDNKSELFNFFNILFLIQIYIAIFEFGLKMQIHSHEYKQA